jgi:hypothetical protein
MCAREAGLGTESAVGERARGCCCRCRCRCPCRLTTGALDDGRRTLIGRAAPATPAVAPGAALPAPPAVAAPSPPSPTALNSVECKVTSETVASTSSSLSMAHISRRSIAEADPRTRLCDCRGPTAGRAEAGLILPLLPSPP